jgi:hypothetical protein
MYVRDRMAKLGNFVPRKSYEKGMLSQPYEINQSGTVYVGEWKNGQPHGFGKMYFPDSSLYVGTFRNGHADGEGQYIYSNGSFYEGEIQNNQAEGNGTF